MKISNSSCVQNICFFLSFFCFVFKLIHSNLVKMKGIKTSFTVSFVVKMKGIKTSFTVSFVVKMKGIKTSFTVSFVN